jgi:hypothetical protein
MLGQHPKMFHQRFLFLGCISMFFTVGMFRQHAKLIRQSNGIEEPIMPSSVHTRSDLGANHEMSSRRKSAYSRLRTDQSGWVIFDMLKAHAYAFSQNMTYGGACGESTHKEDVQQVLTAVGWEHILPLKCPSQNDGLSRVYPSNYFEPKHGRRMGADTWKNFIKNNTDYSYFDGYAEAMSATAAGGYNSRSNFKQKPFSIVVHIRRRDVTPCCYPDWYLPNSYFSSMIENYRQKHEDKNVTVHIFSQSKSHESWDNFADNNTDDYNLHLDGPVGDVWKAILSADVFIGSISEFSRVPALFARGEIPDPRNIADADIAAKTAVDNKRLLDQCAEFELFQCKNKWWMDKKITK